MRNDHLVIGLMSGTSLDGIDASIVRIIESDAEIQVESVHFSTLPFSKEIKEKILHLCDPQKARIEDISSMNMLLGELFAEASLKVIKEAGLTKEDILLISSHGQTIFHQPEPVLIHGKEISSTLQIGDIGVIAERTGILTVGDFRTRDMAAGGQGAPLIPFADYMLFREKEFGRVMVNIGGISNITVIPKGCKSSEVIAYDTGPGNMIIDAFASFITEGKQSYDKDGALAAKGTMNKKWLEELLQHDYYKYPSPKSTGRELFGIEYAKKLWGQANTLNDMDKIATITELTAKTLTMEIKKYIDSGEIKEVLVSGGGSNNKTLMKRIEHSLFDEVRVMGTDIAGVHADEKEAVTFALLGYLCYLKKPNNLPSATGANKEVIMGKIAW